MVVERGQLGGGDVLLCGVDVYICPLQLRCGAVRLGGGLLGEGRAVEGCAGW